MKTVCCGREREIQNLGRGAWGGGVRSQSRRGQTPRAADARTDFPLPDSAFQNIDHDIPLLFTSYDHLLLKSRFKSPERGPIIRSSRMFFDKFRRLCFNKCFCRRSRRPWRRPTSSCTPSCGTPRAARRRRRRRRRTRSTEDAEPRQAKTPRRRIARTESRRRSTTSTIRRKFIIASFFLQFIGTDLDRSGHNQNFIARFIHDDLWCISTYVSQSVPSLMHSSGRL